MTTPFQPTSRVNGPVNAPMGYERPTVPTPPADAAPPGWATQRGSRWGQIQDSVATLPKMGPGSGFPGAIAAGRELGNRWGAEDAGQPAADSGYGQEAGNGDGGEDDAPATRADVQGLHSRFDELSASVGNLGNANQNASLQQSTPAAMPPRESPLAQSAAQRDAAHQQMAQGQALMRDQAANRNNIWNSRQQASSQGMAQPNGTGNGIGATTGAANLNGILRGTPMHPSSGVGASEGTFANTKWGSG